MTIQARLWSFGEFEFDEASRVLRNRGQEVALEAKPLEVLYQLLLRAGEVLTKDELLDAAWPGLSVVEGSLPTAISKLRRGLQDDDQVCVLTVPRIGYRLGVPVHVTTAPAARPPELGLRIGDTVPGREQWRLMKALDLSASSEVWLAEHPKTHELRVFKFASDGVRLRALKREVTLARLIRESLGERQDFVRVLEWNFETAPFFIESEYGGLDLRRWTEERGGIAAIALKDRLAILIDIASAVAAAHDIGVLHKDLKPANVLVTELEGQPQIKVADFGSGSMTEPARLQSLGITNLGFTQTAGLDEDVTGTPMYLAPEVLAGQSPTAGADVYALGVMLYQLMAGDFRKPLSPGWEADIADPAIREDIAAAASGDPAKRLATAALLAEGLRNLEARRASRRDLDEARGRAVQAEQKLTRERARRPWIAAAILALVAGLAISLYLYGQASRQTYIAAAVNQFLATDVLGRGNPFQSGKSAETLVEAIQEATANIDRKFGDVPEVAARLHQAIAKALDNRSDWRGARAEYARAAELFAKAEGTAAPNTVIVKLQMATMEARTYEKDSLGRAKAILASQTGHLAGAASGDREVPIWLATARGMIALIENDAKRAAEQFGMAVDRAEALQAFDENARMTLKQRLAFATIRMGDGPKAEQLFRELIAGFTRSSGAESPNVLRVRMNLAQALMVQNKHREAIAETTAIYPAYVERLGADHELTLQLLTTRAQSEGTLGLWDEAIRDDMAVYRIAVKKQGPQSFFAVATLSDGSLAECRGGRARDGAKHAREAYEISVKAFGPKAGLTGGTAYALASCLIEVGSLDEAAALLGNIDRAAVAQLAGIADWEANVDLALGQIALRKRDMERARKHLAAATPAFIKADAEPFQKRALETLRASLK